MINRSNSGTMTKLLNNTKLILVSGIILFATNFSLMAQTNPEPYNLSDGNYSFTSWDSTSPAGTFPSNMIFHFVPANEVVPFYTDGTSDYDCNYHRSKRPRINGLMGEGIGIVTTSSAQYNNCDSGAANNRFMGDILVAVNTSGRGNVSVQWLGETVIPGDGSPAPRIWNLRLQYRIGSSGLFTDVPGPVEYIASSSAGSPHTFGPTLLPPECWNKALVQVRWIYFESYGGDGGSRPKLRLDDIEITSDIFEGIDDYFSNADGSFDIYPNPASGQFTLRTNASLHGTIKVLDILGNELLLKTPNTSVNSIDCSGFPAGIYIVQITDDKSGLLKTKKLILR
jgi:hypothetical protein